MKRRAAAFRVCPLRVSVYKDRLGFLSKQLLRRGKIERGLGKKVIFEGHKSKTVGKKNVLSA